MASFRSTHGHRSICLSTERLLLSLDLVVVPSGAGVVDQVGEGRHEHEAEADGKGREVVPHPGLLVVQERSSVSGRDERPDGHGGARR